MSTRLWTFLTTDIRDLVSLDTADCAADAADALLGLAEVLAAEGPKVQQLAPLVNQIDSLLDALNSPLGKLVGATLPFISIGTGLLKFYLETTKKEPTLAQSVAMISQAAYLESFREFVKRHPKVEQWIVASDGKPQAKAITGEVQALGTFDLTDKEARLAMLYFHESELAKVFNKALSARLIQLGAKLDQANKFAEAVAQNTNRHMQTAIADAAPSIQRIAEWYRIGGNQVFEKYFSIDTYLEKCIASAPHAQVFDESFTFNDIYVSLQAQALTAAGEPDNNQEPLVLEDWAKQCLNDSTKANRVMFVQGGPGRGKSVFCCMFADWVRRHEHPRWTPILIRLRDVAVQPNDFEKTLAKAIGRNFINTNPGWLTDRNVNFLFILDGFDELVMGRALEGLDELIRDVGNFQKQCADNSEKKHRVLITGRTLSLQSIESSLPDNLERVEILPMDDDLQSHWFIKWGRLTKQDPNDLKGVFKDPRLPERLQELAREPLLLYLLAAMHRDGDLHLEMFDGAEGAKAKVLIYETALAWVLTKQRPVSLNRDIVKLDTKSLRRILMEAGLCVVQSGMEFARISAIEQRLQQDSAAKQFLETAQKKLAAKEAPLRNALAAFYMQSGRQGEGSIEFMHKSFSEFLCAERIVKSLIDWCQPGGTSEYDIPKSDFLWGVYDLLGCYVLTPEIVEYVTALLTKHENAHLDLLHKRLYDFYWRWGDGEFIDEAPENLPQRKMRELRNQFPDRKDQLGQRQVDVHAGLNAMILLLELHRYGLSIPEANKPKPHENPYEFLPCGSPDKRLFDPQKLIKIIGISHCISIDAFVRLTGSFYQKSNLVNVDLYNANLFGSNFSEAQLFGARLANSNLMNANFQGANLNGADLSSCDLRGANLSCANIGTGSNLSRANLGFANLSSAQIYNSNFSRCDLHRADLSFSEIHDIALYNCNLTQANFRHAKLNDVNLIGSNLSQADFSNTIFWSDSNAIKSYENTIWDGARGLETSTGLPESIKHHLGLDHP